VVSVDVRPRRTAVDQTFIDVLRAHLPRAEDGPLEPETRLRDLGLDSMRSIELLFAVEDAYAIVMPDERLTDDTFATAGGLWTAVSETRGGLQGGTG